MPPCRRALPFTALLTPCGHTNPTAGGKSASCLFTPQAQQALVLGDKDIPLFLRNILWRVATSGADEDGTGHGDGPEASPEVFRSPQLLRFAAHLALLLAAQCPYLTTMEEETVEAIEDVVFAYTQHLAKTHQVRWLVEYCERVVPMGCFRACSIHFCAILCFFNLLFTRRQCPASVAPP